MSRKKKILFIGPSTGLNGGVASVIETLQAENKDDELFEVSMLATVRTTKKILYIFDYLIFLIKFINNIVRTRFDLVHIHLASRGSSYRKIFVMTILSFYKIPYLVHLHGGEFKLFFDSLPRWLADFMVSKLASAEYVVALSGGWKNWLCTSLMLKNVRVVENGALNAKRGSLKSECGPTILFFGGRLEDQKGVDVLLKACSQLKPTIQYQIHFAGDGDIKKYISFAKELGIYERCIFFGWLDKEVYYEKLNKASIFVLPSFNEGMPMGIIEAMSIGLPVVSTAVGGIPELVSDQETGLLVSPGNSEELTEALTKIIEDEELAENLSISSYQMYKKRFSGKRMYIAFRKLYEEIIEG